MKGRIKNTLKLLAIVLSLASNISYGQIKKVPDSSLSFFKNKQASIKPFFENLPVNAIRPDGWIRSIMQQDITQGSVGQLDELVPKIINEDIFHTARRKSKTDIPNAGTQVMTGVAWEISMQWWGGETQGNWWDGFMRNAFLTNNKAAMLKATNFVNRMIASQEADGYMGIYGKNLRYQHEGDNGELWTQTTLFRLLLGYYEMTGDKKVLQAVEKAMTLTMSKYNDNAVSPFKAKTDFGGLTYRLMMTDVCETLGNSLFDSAIMWNHQEWAVDETVSKLLRENKIKDVIVIGVWNNEEYRHSEYFPQKILKDIPSKVRKTIIKEQLRNNPLADNYLKFLVKELKPFIDSAFSTLKDRSNTFIAGSSMGGLVSLYAVCEYPSVFGGAACLSTHTPMIIKEKISSNVDRDIAAKFRNYLTTHLPNPATHKIYMDYGDQTLDSFYMPYQKKIDAVLKAKGYNSSNWITKFFPG